MLITIFTNINTDYIIVFMLFMVETFCTLVCVCVCVGGGCFSKHFMTFHLIKKTYMEETCKFCVLSLDLNSQRHLECYKVIIILRKIAQVRKTGVKYESCFILR